MHAWATLLVYESEVEQRGVGDVAWLKRAFQKLLVNFTWWVNRKDPTGRNVFEGGFLGLDNIGVFDRSAPLPTGGHLEQSDGTAWMAFFSQAMLGIALELSQHDPMYEDMVLKFAEHFVFIAAAMDRIGDNRDELWDEEDGFFYDVLRLPDGQASPAQGALDGRAAAAVRVDGAAGRGDAGSATSCWRRLAAPPRGDARAARHHPRRPPRSASTAGACWRCSTRTKLRRVLARMLDENEFLSPHGMRALSRDHADHPYSLDVHGQQYEVSLPAGRVRHRHVRRQLQLARPGVVPGQLPAAARPAAPVRLLRRRLHGGVPDRLGAPVHALRGGRASSAAG